MNTRTDAFLDYYKQLEQIVKSKFDPKPFESPIGFLLKRREFYSIHEELRCCQEVRNYLSHNPKIKGNYSVEPSEEMVSLLRDTVEKVKNPPLAISIAIKRQHVLCKTMADFVRPAMEEMNRHSYTHIPIIENDVVCGVFSENTILSYLVDEEIVCIDSDVRFSDLDNYLPFHKHTAETFRFVSRNAMISEIVIEFENALSSNERIGMIFVTANGKPNERVLGIITAWDIAGNGLLI